MAIFTHPDHNPIENFYAEPCSMGDIHVNGLKEGEILVSYDPYMILNANGLAIGINESFKQFYHLDQNREVVSIIGLDWVTSCKPDTKAQENAIEPLNQINTSSMPQWLGFYSLEMSVTLILMLGLWRVIVHEKD